MSLIDQAFTSQGLTITPYHLLGDEKLLDIVRIRNDDRVRTWMDNQAHIPLADHLSFCRSLRERRDSLYCAVELEDNVVGAVYLTEIDLNQKSAELGLFRNPDIKMTNVGVTLMSVLEDVGRRIGVKTLRLHVRRENERAIKLYRKAGYRETERSEAHLFMEKAIPS